MHSTSIIPLKVTLEVSWNEVGLEFQHESYILERRSYTKLSSDDTSYIVASSKLSISPPCRLADSH